MGQPKQIVLAVIEREGRFLVALRPASAELGGRWEFPGGKIEPGETPAMAMERECKEELGCSVARMRPLGRVKHDYGDFSVRLRLIHCELGPGDEPRPLSATRLQWVTLAELRELRIPEANHRLIEIIENNLRAEAPASRDGSLPGPGQGVP